MDDSAFIHTSKIQSLAIEMFCDSRDLSPPIMNDIFMKKDNSPYNLRQMSQFSRPLVKSVYPGSESVPFRRTKIWEKPPDDCRLCKIYIKHISFV